MTDLEIKEFCERYWASRTPEERRVVLDAQRESWARGEMALSALVKKRYVDGGVVYEDYASYCLD
jgi:hypothetical protein